MQQLPNNIEIEKSLIWAMLIDENIINLITLKQDDFYDNSLWKLYNLIKNIKWAWSKVDLVIVNNYLVKNNLTKIFGITDLVELTELATSYNWKNYEEIIRDNSHRRQMIVYARNIEKLWFEWDIWNALQKIENISEYIFEISPKKQEEDNIFIYVNAFEDFRDKIKDRKGMLWFPTIFPLVDKYTKWQQEWKVTTLVAYSNVWKSKISYAYVNNFLKQGKKVMYLSLEVDKAMLFSNLLANYYNKHYFEVLEPSFFYKMEDFENLEIYDNLYKLEDIKNVIRAKSPDIVFIDFIQNIQTSWTETEKMTRIAQELQQLAIMTWISFFNLSQANNESRFKDWEWIQPKWSWAIFASTDLMFTLHRENKELYFTIAKNKFWPCFKKFLLLPDETFSNFVITETQEQWLTS